MAYDWLNARTIRPTPKSFYKPAPKTVKKPPIIKPGDRRPNQYTDTGGENVPTFYNPTPAPAPAKKVLAQPVAQTPPTAIPDYSGPWQNQYPAWMKPPVNKPSASWVNPLPEQHRRPAYFNNRSTPANFYRWLDSFEQPEKAIEVIEKDYQQYEKTLNEQLDFIGSGPPNPVDQLMDKDTPWWVRLGAASQQALMNYGQGANLVGNKAMIEDYQRKFMNTYIPEDERLYAEVSTPDNPQGTIYGNRFILQRDTRDYAIRPDNTNKFLTDYQGMDQARDNSGKAYQLQYALTQASPIFQPITDEYGNVLAPALMTPDEYIKGLEEQTIFDPLLPDSKFSYGKTQLVFQDGKLIPAEEWFRTVGDHLIGGNWELPEFTDQTGFQYNSMQNWGNPSMAVGLENKSLQNAMNDAKITGNQFINPNFYPHINYQLYDQVVSGNEQVEDSYGEDEGDYGYGYGYGYGGSIGGYGPNYYNDAYRQNKGQYYSQLARWVI